MCCCCLSFVLATLKYCNIQSVHAVGSKNITRQDISTFPTLFSFPKICQLEHHSAELSCLHIPLHILRKSTNFDGQIHKYYWDKLWRLFKTFLRSVVLWSIISPQNAFRPASDIFYWVRSKFKCRTPYKSLLISTILYFAIFNGAFRK